MEHHRGFEPPTSAWKADMLPLNTNDARHFLLLTEREKVIERMYFVQNTAKRRKGNRSTPIEQWCSWWDSNPHGY